MRARCGGYRPALLMRQSDSESTRVYAAKYQKLRRQADIQDGTQLVLNFWCSLRESVCDKASITVSSQYGSKLSEHLESMIDLVLAATNDSVFSTTNNFDGNRDSSERSSRKRDAPATDNDASKGNNQKPTRVSKSR
ncbi:unnamed protein product [Mucor hiemalis]